MCSARQCHWIFAGRRINRSIAFHQAVGHSSAAAGRPAGTLAFRRPHDSQNGPCSRGSIQVTVEEGAGGSAMVTRIDREAGDDARIEALRHDRGTLRR